MNRSNSPHRTFPRQTHALNGRQSSLQRYRMASRGSDISSQPAASPAAAPITQQPVAQVAEPAQAPVIVDKAEKAETNLSDILQSAQQLALEEVQSQPAFTPMTASYQTAIDGLSNFDLSPMVDDAIEEPTPKVFLDTIVSSSAAPQPDLSDGSTTESYVPVMVAVEKEEKPAVETKLVEAKKTENTGSNLVDIYNAQKASVSKKPSHLKTLTISALACGMLAVGVFTFFARVDSAPIVAQPVGPAVIEVEVPVNNTTQGNAADSSVVAADPNHPVRIVISKAGVNAPVMGLGLTHDGLIDVPEAYGVVGWYNKGVLPGQNGPAVIVGHYTEGLGGAFDKLHQIEEGDLITVTNGKGQNFTYKMTKKKEYDKAKVPMQQLFATGDKSRLEIITCAGKWQSNDYDKRLVVTAELVR